MRFLVSLLLLCTSIVAPAAQAEFRLGNAPQFDSATDRFVTVDEAFPFNFFQQNDQVYIDWQVKPGYYLYQDRISVQGQNVTLGPIQMEEGQPYHDEFFGDVKIYTEPLFIQVPLKNIQPDATLTVQYQGCAKAGFCYPPETRNIPLAPLAAGTASGTQIPEAAEQKSGQKSATVIPPSEQNSLAAKLSEFWWTPLLFLLLGVGLAFTPCVLPMYPILTSIVLGGGQRSHKQAFGLAFVYVQGMALTYTLLGLIVASAGMQFQAAMQHPFVLIGLSLLFVLLALSMFGVYTIQMPSRIQTWLNSQSNRQQGGSLTGVFAMGAISGLVCSPCTTAPLSGALLYIAQSGDLFTGGIALYGLAIGMGIPLILAAMFGNRLLPKAGAWMENVKILFGFILLTAPLFLLDRLLPEIWMTSLWSLLGIVAFGWLFHSKNKLPFGGWKQSLLGIIAVLGILASAQPALHYWWGNSQAETNPGAADITFVRIKDYHELQQQLEQAKIAGKPVMLDFYADWCVACKEFDKYTFHQADVAGKLKNFILLQADVTQNQPVDIELLKNMQVLGLPTIDFWSADGEYQSAARITGFMPAPTFLTHLNRYKL